LDNTTEDATIQTECRHHWVIDTAHGPTSKGKCKNCGAEKEFLNYAPGLWRGDDIATVLGLPHAPDIEPDQRQDTS
jgi:hypothetical protein